MTTIAQVRQGLADAITAGTGLRGEAIVHDSINAPCFEVVRKEMDPRMIFSGAKAQYQFTVRVFQGRTSVIAAQEAIDDLCEINGDGSLLQAVETSSNWDITIDYAEVTRIGETGGAERGGIEYLMVEFDVEVVW